MRFCPISPGGIRVIETRMQLALQLVMRRGKSSIAF